MNAQTIDLFEHQALMSHKTSATTQGYVNMSKRLNNVFVPSVLRIAESG